MSAYHVFLLICSVLVVGVLAELIFKRNRREHAGLWCDLCDCGRRPYVHEESCTCLCHG